MTTAARINAGLSACWPNVESAATASEVVSSRALLATRRLEAGSWDLRTTGRI
jgi:hypothetical protein